MLGWSCSEPTGFGPLISLGGYGFVTILFSTSPESFLCLLSFHFLSKSKVVILKKKNKSNQKLSRCDKKKQKYHTDQILKDIYICYLPHSENQNLERQEKLKKQQIYNMYPIGTAYNRKSNMEKQKNAAHIQPIGTTYTKKSKSKKKDSTCTIRIPLSFFGPTCRGWSSQRDVTTCKEYYTFDCLTHQLAVVCVEQIIPRDCNPNLK
jgi:hypothetical protein